MSSESSRRCELSVLLCTHNPDSNRLQHCLEGLACQTLDQACWELLVIDNASSPALQREVFSALQHPQLRLIREAELGLTPARLAGINAARAEVIVFVDDDNVLAPDYLTQALHLMQQEPHVGAAGGILVGSFERTPPRWSRGYLDLLGVRDFGPRPIRALIYDQVGPWEPIGAGMVIRRAIAAHYALIAVDPVRRGLDRRGRGLGSCGDTDMARCASDLGYFLAYEPSLRLTHLIPAFRLRYGYLFRLVRALKCSGILLDRLRTGTPTYLGSPILIVVRFAAEALRQFTADPRLWLLRLGALIGEYQARSRRLNLNDRSE